MTLAGATMGEHRRPDPFDVDLEALGDASAQRRAGIDADPALVAERAEVAELRDWWHANAPPLAVPRRRRPPAMWAAAVGGALALAAAGLLVLRPADDPSRTDDPGPAIIARGKLDVAIVAVRAGMRLPPDSALQAGDEIALSVMPAADAHVAVATVEEGGEVSVLVTGADVRAGVAYAPPGRVRLDAHPGREWLVVWVGDVPEPGQIESAARALLPAPVSTEQRLVHEITRGDR